MSGDPSTRLTNYMTPISTSTTSFTRGKQGERNSPSNRKQEKVQDRKKGAYDKKAVD